MSGAAAYASRRGLPRERVFLAALLAAALLLASGLMLHRQADDAAPRTFRDGFTVAEDVVRRVEGNTSAPSASPSPTPTPTPTPAGGNVQVVVGEPDRQAHTTTIKTEDGDEITIKHGGSAKRKVTTISRDEGGKITIENVEHDEPAVEETPARREETAGMQHGDVEHHTFERLEEADAVTEEPAADGKDEPDDDDTIIVSTRRKVTVVQVGRNATKLEFEDLAEELEPSE